MIGFQTSTLLEVRLDRAAAIRRRAIKRQLRLIGVEITDQSLYDLSNLRKIRDKFMKTIKHGVVPEEILKLSSLIRSENGEAERKLSAKCKWEAMTRTAVLITWGHPDTWNK